MMAWCISDDAKTSGEALANHVAQGLQQAIVSRGIAVLAVSGGKSPLPFFHALRKSALPWHQVIVTLADDRRVDEASPLSNAALVRGELLQDAARVATFVPLHHGHANLPLPFDMLVLGMGNDAHTASLFPGQPMRGDGPVISVSPDPMPPEAPVMRWSWSLDVLRSARNIALLIAGEQKRAVLEQALASGDFVHKPVAAVLHNPAQPVTIFWSA